MKKIAVIGLGKVGSLVAILLSKKFSVVGYDKEIYDEFKFQVKKLNINELDKVEKELKNFDGVVSCLPYDINILIAKIACKIGIHYFDLSEDVHKTNEIIALANKSKCVMIPQCGLAPGFIGIMGYDLCKKFTKLRDVELRVGALPKYPNGLLGYSFNWSPAGLINEYLNDAEMIENGELKWISSLTGIETINIGGQEYEAFTTSGGLGTLCQTLKGKVDTLNYKTIRYPGHAKLMRFLLYELILKDKRKLVEEILTEAKPPVKEDIVLVYAAVEGWKGKRLEREEFFKCYSPKLINGKEYRAISWTTATSVCSVVELVSTGKLKQKGFVKQEDIKLEDFFATSYGKLYIDEK